MRYTGLAVSLTVLLMVPGCGVDSKSDTPDMVDTAVREVKEPVEVLPELGEADVCGSGCAGLLTPPTLVKAGYTVVVGANSTSGIPGQKFTLEARKARGTPAGDLSWKWNLDGGVSSQAEENTATLEASFPAKGQYLVSVEAKDGQGNHANAGILVTINSQSNHLVGDVTDDGEVGQSDASLVVSHIAGELQLAPSQFERADVDLDGKVTSLDADLIQSAVDESAAAPRYLAPAEGSLGTRVLLVHPALLAPGDIVTVRFDGSDPIVPLRASPGHAVFPVPPDQDTAGTVTLRVLLEGQEVDQFDFLVLPVAASSADPGQKVTEAMELLATSLDAFPLLLDGYLTPLKTSATQRAVLHGLLTVASDSYAANGDAFRSAFQTMDAEGRAAFEKVALANGLDESLASLANLKERTLALSEMGPEFLVPGESAAVLQALCAARDILDAADKINEINAIASGYLCWFDWWPLNASPEVTGVIAYLSDMSGALGVVSGVLSLVRPYLPEIGDFRLDSTFPGLQQGQDTTISGHLMLDIPHSLCSDAAAQSIPGLMEQLEKQLALQMAASIPLAGQAYEAGQFSAENASELSALIYDVISDLAGGVFDELAVSQVLLDMAGLVCALTHEGVPMGAAGLESDCGTPADDGTWQCQLDCEGTTKFSATISPCDEDREASLEVICGGCSPANCKGCCADGECIAVGVQHEGQCGVEGTECELCPDHFDCDSGTCQCSSDCQGIHTALRTTSGSAPKS